MRSFLFFSYCLIILVLLFGTGVAADPTVIIYKSESCGHCSVYLQELKALLAKQGITSLEEKSMLADKTALQELDAFTRERDIPYDMQGHMVTRINDLVLEGHIPLEVLEELFATYPGYAFPKLVLFQDAMDPLVTDYKLLEQKRQKECTTERSLEFCREQAEQKTTETKSLFSMVMFGALLAGLHPCTISVLLFFIAFLLTLRRSRAGILKVGFAYIAGIFVAYLGIGFGLFKAVTFVDTPHLAAKVGAVLVLLLGLFNIGSYFRKGTWSLGMPKIVKPTIANLLQRTTLPAVFLVGMVVGVCSFGCTAGIYLSIMSLLWIKTQYLQGIFYLVLYNLMFILPLIIILIVAGNKRVIQKLERLEATKSKYLKLISGIVMIVLAIIIFWMTAG